MRLNPLAAKARRTAAAEARILSAKINECRLVAVWLWRSAYDAILAAEIGPATEAAFRRWKAAMPLMHFFATYGVLPFACTRPVCRRARRCACDSMRCVRYETLSNEEELEARAIYYDFIRFMKAPEEESDQEVSGRA